jgi:phenylpropionate dioxygenase-like ring-hydroxylating dioxygenase large terminal subunit
MANEWNRPDAPPPPLFTGKKEKDFVKQINDEVIERVIGQGIFYYPISIEHTEFHEIYGEAITKTFLPPVRVHALVEWAEYVTETGKFGVDRRRTINVHFHKRRLTEDQNLYVREGDFVKYGDLFYEIVSLIEPKELFGQSDTKMEIVAKCIRAREGKFNAK